MKKRITIGIGILFSYLAGWSQNSIGGIGSWREHFNNHSIQQVVKGDKIYAASWYQLVSVDPKGAIEYIGKSNGLNEVGIKKIRWHEATNQLMIAYENSNIDIIKGDQIYSLKDIELTNLFSDKGINDLYLIGNWALVSTNFGIVVVDLIKHEIKDTWFPNNNRQASITYQVATTLDSLYAVTENGIFSTALKNNWINSNQWNNLPGYNGLGIQKITSLKNTIYPYTNKVVYQYPSTQPIIGFITEKINCIKDGGDGLLIALSNKTNKGAVIKLNTDKRLTTLIDTTVLSMPVDLLLDESTYWIADSAKGLLQKNITNNWIPIGGPIQNIEGDCFINSNALLAPFGNKATGFSSYSALGWINYTQIKNTTLPYLTSSAIDPLNENWWFTSDNNLVRYDQNANIVSTILPSNLQGNLNNIHIGDNGNIWVMKDEQGILIYKNNNWELIVPPSDFIKKGIKRMILSKSGQAWMTAPNHQGIYVYQSTQNYTTAAWKKLTTTKGSGNLPSNFITCIAEDKLGSIWLGSDNGIGIINCGDISNEVCDADLPIVLNNGFLGTLFQKETINAITVDGANRKWIATNNGAWLLSADGNTIIAQFDRSNAPIPSDSITQIMVAPLNGEVFINTKKGMVSYRGTATQEARSQQSIHIYPNPIAPNYEGPIALNGLVENALVKITDLNGMLVFQTRSLGGQAVWNGKTYEGRKVASGIYLVFTRDDSGNEKSVGKIVIASGQ